MSTRAPSRRLHAVDAARGLALIGMIIVNVGPSVADDTLQRLYLLPYGRASVLFVLIAGISMTMMLHSPSRSGSRPWPLLLWRIALLLFGGLSLQLLSDSVSVILPTYALLFAVAPVLHRIGSRILLILAAALTLIGPVIVIATEVTAGRAKLPAPDLLDRPDVVVESMIVSGPYPLLIWSVPFVIGIWLGRLDLRDRTAQRRMITFGSGAALAGLLLPFAIEVTIGGQPQQGYSLLLTGAGHGQMPLWILSSTGSAVLVLGVLLLGWPEIGRWCRPLAAMGKLALTLYVAHLVVIIAIGGQAASFHQGAVVSGTIVLGSLIMAPLWQRLLGAGPLERLYRGPQRRGHDFCRRSSSLGEPIGGNVITRSTRPSGRAPTD